MKACFLFTQNMSKTSFYFKLLFASSCLAWNSAMGSALAWCHVWVSATRNLLLTCFIVADIKPSSHALLHFIASLSRYFLFYCTPGNKNTLSKYSSLKRRHLINTPSSPTVKEDQTKALWEVSMLIKAKFCQAVADWRALRGRTTSESHLKEKQACFSLTGNKTVRKSRCCSL